MQGGLLPNHMIWVNASSHDDVWSYAKSVLSKGCLMEHEYYDWNSRPQGRVEDWGDLGHGHLIGGHLVASDGYYEWHGKQYLKESKSLYHLCRDDRKKCKDKLSRGGGREGGPYQSMASGECVHDVGDGVFEKGGCNCEVC